MRKISNESNVVEEILLKFISLILANREVDYVKNAIYDNIEYNPDINMGMSPVISLVDNITFYLPFNDLRYMDIIINASKRAVYQDYSILSIAKENGYSVNNNVVCDFSNESDYLMYLTKKVRNEIGSLNFNELIDYYDLMEKRKKRLRENGK